MIVRIWKATATNDGSRDYQSHFERNVMPELKALAGFLKAYLLKRARDGVIDIEVHTLWESLEAIRAFAAPDIEVAVVEPEARAALVSYDTTVTHFTALEYSA